MPLSSQYIVDFSRYRKSLLEQALSRLLSQHYDKCVLRQFVTVFIEEIQELYDALIDLQEKRIPFNAENENLNALGLIVGEDRMPWAYDDTTWAFTDIAGQGADQERAWCKYAPLGLFLMVDDLQYRVNIILKAIKNHTLTSSAPEIINLVKLIFGLDISFEKTGPNTVNLIVPNGVSMTQIYLLVQASTNEQVDDKFFLPYPATLSIENVYMETSVGDFFIFDVENRGFDISTMMGAGRVPVYIIN